jgi:hypothetical protein
MFSAVVYAGTILSFFFLGCQTCGGIEGCQPPRGHPRPLLCPPVLGCLMTWSFTEFGYGRKS